MTLLSYTPAARVFWPELETCRTVPQTERELNVRVDLVEEENRFVLSAELPGVRPEDLKVSLEKGRLSLSGEKKDAFAESKAEALRSERRYGSFSRSFELNGLVDESRVEASFADGVLSLSLPKHESQKPRQVEIKIK